LRREASLLYAYDDPGAIASRHFAWQFWPTRPKLHPQNSTHRLALPLHDNPHSPHRRARTAGSLRPLSRAPQSPSPSLSGPTLLRRLPAPSPRGPSFQRPAPPPTRSPTQAIPPSPDSSGGKGEFTSPPLLCQVLEKTENLRKTRERAKQNKPGFAKHPTPLLSPAS